MPDELFRLTIHEAAVLLRRREISSVELTQAVLDRVYAVDNAVKAYLAVLPEAALADAAAADKALAEAGDGAELPALLGHSPGDQGCDPGRGRAGDLRLQDSWRTSFHPSRRR